jgi:hypothetical protein
MYFDVNRGARLKTTAAILRTCLALILLPLLSWTSCAHGDDRVLFRDNFQNLDAWKPLFFPKITRHTTYEIQDREGVRVLVASSDNSASALVNEHRFNVAEYPVLHWRWKVDNIYKKGNYRLKSGDDYPIRIYVFFKYNPKNAPLGMKIKYGLAKSIYGRYPPHSSLNYIWANREDETGTAASPFTDRSIMIPLEHGPQKVGQWVEETVNVLEDYRKAFGTDPPLKASVAIMNDSDNTGERATSYIQFLEVRK